MSDPGTGRWQRISEHFDRAIQLPPESGLEWLDDVEPDASIREEVRALVAAHHRAEGFLEPGSLPLPDAKGFEEWDEGSIGPDFVADPSGRHRGPGTIGPWNVVKELGSGGMGTVYLATRGEDQYRQAAAVKLIRAGRATEEIVRRFRRERQILATLEHPGIARMIDGGTSADGTPVAGDGVRGRRASVRLVFPAEPGSGGAPRDIPRDLRCGAARAPEPGASSRHQAGEYPEGGRGLSQPIKESSGSFFVMRVV